MLGRAISLTGRLPRVALRSPSPVERDVLGLGLIALGVFMAFVLYGGWNGGGAGHALAVAFGWLLGRARVLAPLALCAGGGALVVGGVLPDLRPLRGGAICLFASLTLALAAGMAGISAPRSGSASTWSSSFLHAHGGLVGEALYAARKRQARRPPVRRLLVVSANASLG